MRSLAKGNVRRHLMCFMFKKPPRHPTKTVGGNGHMHVCLDFLRRPPGNRWRGAQPVRCVETNKIFAQRRYASASLNCEQIWCATWSSPVDPPVFHILTFLRPHVYMTRADRWRGAQPVLRLVMHFVLFFCFHNTRPEEPQSDVGAP